MRSNSENLKSGSFSTKSRFPETRDGHLDTERCLCVIEHRVAQAVRPYKRGLRIDLQFITSYTVVC